MRAPRGYRGCAGNRLLALVLLLQTFPATAQDVFPPPEIAPQFPVARATSAITIDGRLDEASWSLASPITEFVQKEPDQGSPGSHRTEVRLLSDDKALYVSAICFQEQSDLRVQNLQRDFSYEENDLFGLAIDGFLDNRSAVVFQTSPYGNQRDMEVIDSDAFNTDWNARWDVRTRIEADRWTVEMAIPWSTLRYPRDADRLGVIFTRNLRQLNEFTTMPAVPRVYTAYRMAYQGEMVGLATPPPATNLQVTPYVLIENINQDSSWNVEAGGELKWAITPNTVLDATVNTDFAQAEVDRQVVNLDRFSVFFPEKRQFFLENANLFNPSVTNWIRPFFSRRIGLDDSGRPIDIDGGLRLTSRSSSHEIGLLTMSQSALDSSPESTFGVARYSRNLAGQSRLGGMATWRHDAAVATGDLQQDANNNFTYTVDGLWRASPSVAVQAMASVSEDDLEGGGLGGQLWAYYENNWLYVGLLEYYNKDYEPGIGLEILDANYVMHSPAVNLDLRFDALPDFIRSYKPGVSAYIFQDADDYDLLFGDASIVPVGLLFENGAEIYLEVQPNWQRLDEPFFPAGIEIAPGDYDYTRYALELASDQSVALSGSLDVETGDYFDGKLTSYTTSARYSPDPRMEFSVDYNLNQFRDVGLEQENRDVGLLGVSVVLALNSRLQFSSFYQKETGGGDSQWNARLAWEYRPLSYFYLVYNNNHSVDFTNPAEGTKFEQVIAKLTYLFDF